MDLAKNPNKTSVFNKTTQRRQNAARRRWSRGHRRFGVDERQRAFEFSAIDETRIENGFFKARQGWHICRTASHQPAKLRQERHQREWNGICRPDGAENYFGLGFYKYAAPPALETAAAKFNDSYRKVFV